MQVKVDLHVHTIYSRDSLITPKDLVFYAKKRGLTAVAITDHNTVEGALKIAKAKPLFRKIDADEKQLDEMLMKVREKMTNAE